MLTHISRNTFNLLIRNYSFDSKLSKFSNINLSSSKKSI